MSINDEDCEEMIEDQIEEILDKRTKDGRVEYYLRWKGRTRPEDNTWECLDEGECQELIEEFEERRKAKLKRAQAEADSTSSGSKKKQKRNQVPANGFDHGYTIKRIVGATNASGEIKFLIKWREVDEFELLPSSIVNVKDPQKVIKFYQDRSIWSTSDDPDANLK